MGKTKETELIFKSWKSFLNEHRIISREEIVKSLQTNNRSDREISFFMDFWSNNSFITKYTQVIQNEINSTQEPIEEILSTIKLHYNKIYQNAGPKIKDEIGGGIASIDDLRKQIDDKSSFNKNEVRQQCDYKNERPLVGSYRDFDVVYSESDWVVIEPKTIQGSIAWAHGKPDGSEETDTSRRVGWCTGVASENNMFPNYAGNLHMFYIINANYENDNSVNRRLCLSFIIKEGNASLKTSGSSTVNAKNKPIDKAVIKRIQASSFYSIILERLKGRESTSFAEVYSRATLSQILRQKAEMASQNISNSTIKKELKNYVRYTKSFEVLKYFYDEKFALEEIARNLNKETDPDSIISYDILSTKNKNMVDILITNTNDLDIIKNIFDRSEISISCNLLKNKNTPKHIVSTIKNKIINSNSEVAITNLIDIARENLNIFSSYKEIKDFFISLKSFFLNAEYYLIAIVSDIFEDTVKKYNKDVYNDIYWWLNFCYKNLTSAKFMPYRYLLPISSMPDLPKDIIESLIDFLEENHKAYDRSYMLIAGLIIGKNLSEKQKLKLSNVINNSEDTNLITAIYSICRKNEDIQEATTVLFNLCNKSNKELLAYEVYRELSSDSPEIILQYAKQNLDYLKLLFNIRDFDETYEEFEAKVKEADFSNLVELVNSGKFDEAYEEYPDFFDYFVEYNVCKENPTKVRLLLKSKGFDISKNDLIYEMIRDEYGDTYSKAQLNSIVNDEAYGYGYIKDLFDYKVTNESTIRQYIKLLMS